MWSSGWGHWGPTMWTCWCAGPGATVRSAECCLVASRHAWSDAHDSRSWSYHVPRRVPQQPRTDFGPQCSAHGEAEPAVRRALAHRATRSRVVGGLVFLVANRLELESAVRDVEVPTPGTRPAG